MGGHVAYVVLVRKPEKKIDSWENVGVDENIIFVWILEG
jgi:hypothetical protein